jgi:hypothetical protein
MLELEKVYQVTTPYCVYSALILHDIDSNKYVFYNLNTDEYIELAHSELISYK